MQEKRRQKAESYTPPDATAGPMAPRAAPRAPRAASRAPRAAFSAPRPASRPPCGEGTSFAAAKKQRSVEGGRVGGASNAATGSRKKPQKYARLKSYFTASGNV